ncbi:MAG: hypothetical protein WDO16_01280 [Bacteroidota bacterium]
MHKQSETIVLPGCETGSFKVESLSSPNIVLPDAWVMEEKIQITAIVRKIDLIAFLYNDVC